MRRIVLFLALLLACASASAAPGKTPRVVLISIDGWRTDLVKEMPTVQALMKLGSWTLKAETPLPAITVVSHAAMFTGASPEKNGVVTYEPGADRLDAWRPLKVPTLFQALMRDRHSVSAFIQKKKLYGILPKEDILSLGISNGLDQIVDMACAEITGADDDFTFIHLEDIDAAGHASGWMSREQKAAAKRIDTALAELATCMNRSEKNGGLPIVLIITADHGGHDRTHSTAADTDHLVPWIVLGPGVKSRHAIRETVRLIDTAPTIARILGFDPKTLLPAADGNAIGEIFRP